MHSSTPKKLLCILLCINLFLCLFGCGSDNSLPGTGESGKVAFIDWSEYDRLLAQSETEIDPVKRALLLHEAEDMLMDTGALIPIFRNKIVYLKKPNITGITVDMSGHIDLGQVRKEGASPDEPLSFCLCGEPKSLDPVAVTTSDMVTVSLQLFRGLLKFDKENGVKPDLAKSYTVSEDKRTYTFTLRDGLKWSDGSPLNADDFVYSWKRAANKKNGLEYSPLYSCIKGFPDNLCVESSKNGSEFKVELNSPCAYFPYLCAFVPFCAINRKSVESADGFIGSNGTENVSSWGKDDGFLCNGPYIIEKWDHNKSIILKKNPYYYDAENVSINNINLMLATDDAVAYAAYTSNNISILSGSIPPDIKKKLKGTPEYNEASINSCTSIIFNVCSPLFAGMTIEEAATFRKALGWAIDREFIINAALTGSEVPALSYVPDTMHVGLNHTFGKIPGYNYPQKGGYYSSKADLDKAREMLRSIGFEFGDDGKLINPITIEYLFNQGTSLEAIAVCLQSDLAQLGINLVLATREWGVFLGEVSNGAFEVARDGWNADYDDPYGMLSNYISTNENCKTQFGRRP